MPFKNLEEFDYKPLNANFDKYVTQTELVYETRDGKVITVPKGYVSDGASIPRWLWSVAGSPFTGRYVPAAFVHDYLCQVGLEGKPEASWADTHKIFYEAMLDNGCPKHGLKGAVAKYRAVRIGMFFKRWKYDGSK